MKEEKLKELYKEALSLGYAKNLSFQEWKKRWLEMDKDIKEMKRNDEKRLKGLSKAIKETQKIIFGKDLRSVFE